MLKKLIIGVLIIGLALGATFYAIGGKTGALLLYVKYFVRQDPAPYRTVAWQVPPPNSHGHGPNIILIVADDLGFNDITLNGGGIANGTVPTPNINSIAQQGVNFTEAYSGSATCAPSRASMLTGRYPTRFGFEFTPTPVEFSRNVGMFTLPNAPRLPIYHAEREKNLIPYEDQGLPTSEITIAQLLKKADYRTLHIGKWHLGDSPKFRAYAHGFNQSLSLQHGGSMYFPANSPDIVNAQQDFDPIDQFLWASHPWGVRFNDGPVFAPNRYLTDYFTDEAIKAIDANRAQPFFLYLTYNAPHTPLQATREDYNALSHIKDHSTRVYAAMIRNLDRNIGRVLQHLKAQGLDDNTVIIFTSDNGGAHYVGIPHLNEPYRGWKATFFEGGIHVPYFIRWPSIIPSEQRNATPVSHIDLFSTIAHIAELEIPKDRIIDGVNLAPVATHHQTLPERPLFWRTDTYLAMRQGDWKLQLTQNPRKDWLYNLRDDPRERHNLASQEPTRLTQMKHTLTQFNQAQAKPIWPSLFEVPIPLDKTLRDRQSPSDAYVYYSN